MDSKQQVMEGYSDPRDAANEPPAADIWTVCGEPTDAAIEALADLFLASIDSESKPLQVLQIRSTS